MVIMGLWDFIFVFSTFSIFKTMIWMEKKEIITWDKLFGWGDSPVLAFCDALYLVWLSQAPADVMVEQKLV